MTSSRTLILIKPDGVRRGFVGEVLSRLERKGYSLDALKVVPPNVAALEEHYQEHAGKSFFPGVISYMSSGPIVAIVASGIGVIEGFRALAGATMPAAALPGTIRGDFAQPPAQGGAIENLVHGSDSAESAEREIGIWFPEL